MSGGPFFFFGLARKLPASPSVDLNLLTNVALMVPSLPAAFHARFTAAELARAFFARTSLTNWVLPCSFGCYYRHAVNLHDWGDCNNFTI